MALNLSNTSYFMFGKKYKNHSLRIVTFSILCFLLPPLSIFGRRLQHWAYEALSKELLGSLLIGLLAVGIGAVIYVLLRTDWRKLWHVLWLAPIFLWLPWTTMSAHPEERLHFLLFGALGWLAPQIMALPWALLSLLSLAIGDEVLQHFLPSRVGELRDVGVNVLAALGGLLLALVMVKVRKPRD